MSRPERFPIKLNRKTALTLYFSKQFYPSNGFHSDGYRSIDQLCFFIVGYFEILFLIDMVHDLIDDRQCVLHHILARLKNRDGLLALQHGAGDFGRISEMVELGFLDDQPVIASFACKSLSSLFAISSMLARKDVCVSESYG